MRAEKDGAVYGVVKGVGTALITSLLGIIIFGFIVKLAMLNSSVIGAVDQFIKIISVFLGCMFSVGKGKGLIKGLLIGGIYSTLMQLIFAMIFGGITFGKGFFIDLAFMIIVGALSGVITVNVKK